MSQIVNMTGDTLDVDGIAVGAGTGSSTFSPEGVIHVDVTGLGNGADTTEDVIATWSLPANTLTAGTKGLRVRAWFHCASNADNKTMKLYFGSSVITTPTAATNNKNAYLELDIYRTGSSTQSVFGRGLVDTTSVTPYHNTSSAETDTAAITIKASGTAGTGNANDIVCDAFIVEMLN